MATPLTFLLILVTGFISYRVMNSPAQKNKLLFIPYYVNERGEYYRFITAAFIHKDWWHLGVNMIVLYFFGQTVESVYKVLFGTWGALLFLGLYLGGILASKAITYFRHRTNPGYGSLGASGAVSAVLFASILFDPWNEIFIFFIPKGIPGFIFGLIYLAYSTYMDKKGTDLIGHNAHLSGAFFGVLFTILILPVLLPHFFYCLQSGSENCVAEFIMMYLGN
ncbi:MAG: rhomboid family intramembrane serine protease [Bacteroidota bacterium]